MNLATAFREHRDTLARAGAHPPWILVFDIDSTLMDTGPRNAGILTAAFDYFPALRRWRSRINIEDVAWNILEPLTAAGVDDPALLRDVREFWQYRFFADEWVMLDTPYPGAALYLNTLKHAGFSLVYLTGRHDPGMGEGTRASFQAHGLPAGESETFFFKPSFDADDQEFKASACSRIESLGTVAGTLDNEPANVNMFARRFPGALNVWMRTLTSPDPEPLDKGMAMVDPDAFLGSSS